MMEWFQEAGSPVVLVMMMSVFSLGVSWRAILHPSRDAFRLVAGAVSATILMGALGTVIGLQLSISHVGAMDAPSPWLFLVGMRESLNNMVLALGTSVLATGLATFGIYRNRSRSFATTSAEIQ